MLETERLLLRKPQREDADALVPLLTDPRVMRYIGSGQDADPISVIERWLGRWQANGVGHFLIERRQDGAFLGRTGIVVWDTRTWRNTTRAEAGLHAQPELGWALVRPHWGKGYATEAARAVRDWAYEEAGVVRLISLIQPENLASQRVAERLGAVPTESVTLESGVPCVLWLHRCRTRAGFVRG